MKAPRRGFLRLAGSVAALPMAGAAFSAAAAQQKAMKITAVETDLLKRPPGTPIYDAIHQLSVDSGSVVLRIRTDAGITGWADCSFEQLCFDLRIRTAWLASNAIENVRGHLPGAWSGPCVLIERSVAVMQKVGLEAKECDNLRPHGSANRPAPRQ